MNRSLSLLAVTFLALSTLLPALAVAEDMPPAEHKSIGLGFHHQAAPIGVRWWLTGQKIAIDLGVGYDREPERGLYPDEHLSTFRFDVGVPILLKSWSRFHFLFRPGFAYQSEQVTATAPPAAFDTETNKTILVSGELEAEAFLLENFSVSASHGIEYESFDPAGPGDKETSFFTTGNDFTNIGFHVYLFGK